MNQILLHNALIINEKASKTGSVLIKDGLIEAVFYQAVPDAVVESATVVDASGLWLIPGVIDDHVHFRDPGLTHKANLFDESRAALAGGVTSFMEMPNTIPQTTTIEAWKAKMARAADVAQANYAFYLGATNDNLPELQRADFSRVCGIKVFMGSSTGNMLVDNERTLENLFRSIPSIVAVHAESEGIIKANKQKYLAETGGQLPVRFHPLIRSEEACYASTSRAIELAAVFNTRLHVMHVSTAKELTLFEAKPLQDKRVTAEACIGHLWFDDSAYETIGNAIKCNPAIKTSQDKLALRAALTSGLIDVVGTDHAPHTWEEKQGDCLTAASGSPAVQFSLVLMLELVKQGFLTKETLVERMCHAPATLYKIDKRGYIRPGYHADLVLVDPNACWQLTPDLILSTCGWSPFTGLTFSHAVSKTYLNGTLVYEDGRFTQQMAAEALRFNS